jgi:hypothetical protein
MPASLAVACFIVGDCIATRPYGLGGRFSQCGVSAKIGASSSAIVPRVPAVPLKWLVISAGSNDPRNPKLEANLEAMRARASADRVIWVVPVHKAAAKAVRAVAAHHGDAVVPFIPGRDGVHPRSYGALARAVAAKID